MAEERLDVEAPLSRRLLAEFVGTALLVGVGTGAATVLTLGASRSIETVSQAFPGGGGDPVLNELFKGSFGDALPVALAFALVLALVVYAFGGVSGGHFNPAVTLAMAATKRLPWSKVGPYWAAQCLGAIVGTLVIAGIYSEAGATAGTPDSLFGATRVADDVSQLGAILAEAFITFVLVTAIMAVAVDRRAPKGFSGLVIGFALGAGILATGAATGGSANFARSLGPLVASLPYDTRDIPWSDLIVYAAGPALGALAAAFLYESVTGLEQVAPAPAPGAATPPSDEHGHAGHDHDHDHHDHDHDHHHHDHDHAHDHVAPEVAETAAPVVAEDERAGGEATPGPDDPRRV